MRDPFPIVAMLGQRLERERTGWRDMKALVVMAAQGGSWDSAAAIADALGVPPDAQEAIYREVYDSPMPVSEPAATTTELREPCLTTPSFTLTPNSRTSTPASVT